MTPGDRVYFWESGDHAALLAMGQIVSEVDPENPSGRFGSVDIIYESKLEPPIPRQEVLQDPILSQFRVFSRMEGTNFPIRDSRVIEAKGTCDRDAFRMAIGQLVDYRRFMKAPPCAILLPEKPNDDLLSLAKAEGIGIIWPSDEGFEKTLHLW
jgi:hypothetical protein